MTKQSAVKRLPIPATLTPALTQKAMAEAANEVRKSVRKNMKNFATSS